MVVGLAALGLGFGAAPASAALSAVSPVTIAVGPDSVLLPQFYDDGLQQLTICPFGDPNCGAIPVFQAPDGEGFYNRAVAKLDGPGGERMTLVIALEAAFDPVFTSTPITFGRIRSKITAGAPNSVYTVLEPFGTQTITTNATGVGTTTDQVGCVIAAAAAPCDFTAALGTGMTGWLRWDPAVAPAAPAGYLGDGATDHAIIGSPILQNVFAMSGPGIGTVSTDLFAVTGKVFDPTVPAFGAAPVAFAPTRLGTFTDKTAVIRNDGGSAMHVSGVAMTGTDAGDFTIQSNGCATVTPNGGICNVLVRFAPSAAGARSAALAVADDAPGAPHSVSLTGSGTQAVLLATPAGIGFGTQFVGTTTAAQSVTLTNTGSATLTVGALTLGGAVPGDYALGLNTCGSPVAPGASCHLDVSMTPSATGVRNATLHVDSDGGPATVSLSGTGVAPPASGAGGGGATPPPAPAPVINLTFAPNTGSGPPVTTSRPALRLGRLTVRSQITRVQARRHGLRLAMRLPAGTAIVQIKVYRRTAAGLKLLSSQTKVPPAAGDYRVTQGQAALRRRLRRGAYVVKVTPGYSASELGVAARASFSVV
jgi:hypothetical protein